MKKLLISVPIIIFSVIVFIYFLGLINQRNDGKGFRRNIVKCKLEFEYSIVLPDELFGLAGITGQQIFLKRYAYNDQLNLYVVKANSLETLKIKYPSSFHINAHNIYHDYLSNMIVSSNPYGDIAIYNGKTLLNYHIDEFRFDHIKSISPNSVIVRARKTDHNEINRSIAKLSLSAKTMVSKEYVLPKQTNAFFANDGWLTYDSEQHRILYMYFYRGEFLCLDTNLNLSYKSKTIDTVRHTEIRTGIFTQNIGNGKLSKQVTQITPPRFVNKYITTNNSKIYIHSYLSADNDDLALLNNSQIIDVYDIKNGNYLHSFYLPKFQHHNLNEFQISGNRLVGIFGKSVVAYKFTEP